MKKLLGIIALYFFIYNTSSYASGINGSGELQMSYQSVKYFIEYIKINKKRIDGKTPKPDSFIISQDGSWSWYWYCNYNECWQNDKPKLEECERITGVTCARFAKRRTVYWDNGINTKKKKAKFSSKMSDQEIKDELKRLGFYGNKSSTTNTIKEKKTKIAKKNIIEKKSIAFSWGGYEDLILGTAGAEETDDGRTFMNLQLPNNDGNCEGTYLLQNGGLGSWQISCTNKMGAAGTLKWKKNGTITGHGVDYKNNKVKFTVSQKS